MKQILLRPMWIDDRDFNIFKGISVSATMNKKKNYIELEEVDTGLETPAFDLKTIRESRGFTLRDMSSSTRVSLSNLEAIEEQNFGLLPDPIYARAFISAYADTLDIDGKKILSLYNKYLEGLESVKDKNELLKRLAEKKRHTRFWIWLTLASCVIVLTGFFYLYQWNKDNSRELKKWVPAEEVGNTGEIQGPSGGVPAPEKDDIVTEGNYKTPETESLDLSGSTDISDVDDIKDTGQVIEEDKQSAIESGQSDLKNEQPKEEAVPDKAVAVEEGPYILVIEASELTWLQITLDETPPFEVMLRPGERITEKASEKFGLVVGNAAGVKIIFQGKSLGLMGKHGEVVHLTLP